MTTTDRYLPIDEEGYFVFDGRRVDDEELGRTLIKNLKPDPENRILTSMNGADAWVEAFDAPLVLKHIGTVKNGNVEADAVYNSKINFPLSSLSLDEWDRFHGLTEDGIPFVFSRKAQFEFFELLDSFDDDSITVEGKTYPVPPWLTASPDPQAPKFWTDLYTAPEPPPWNLGQEAAALPSLLAQLKLIKARVLVLGSGEGHDAAFLAKQGHVVTAVDFSEEAVKRSREKYSAIENLKIERADAFNLPESWTGRFDLIFEHTFYCAVNPEKRNEIVKNWTRLLAPGGHLLGVFYVMEKRTGPPFGGSEWELRERLKSKFDFLYWTRWHHSIERRKSKELVIFARKR